MKVCVVGGGTGSSAVLSGLVNYPDLELSAIVSMADDGGSNAVIRDQFGLLPLSDLRKSIIALSQLKDSNLLRKMLTYRFDKGDGLTGHTLGNLMMMALSHITGNEVGAIEYLSELFDIHGQVLPATLDSARLVAEYSDGSIMFGEHYIDEPEIADEAKVVKCWIEPKAKIFDKAAEALISADYIIVGPGDLYGTLLATILVDGFKSAVKKSKAEILYIPSLMTKVGQTRGRGQREIMGILEDAVGQSFDSIFINSNEIPERALTYYAAAGEKPIEDDFRTKDPVHYVDLLADRVFKKQKGDTLVRSMVRHDNKKLGWELYKWMMEDTLEK